MKNQVAKRLRTFFMMIGLISYCHEAASAINLQLEIEIQNTASQTNANIPPDSKTVLDVLLAEDYISVKSNQITIIYDFKSRHRYQLNDDGHSYVKYSLYDLISARTMEFKNREMIRGALATAKISEGSGTSVDAEHLFSIVSRTPATIDESLVGENPVFSSNNRQLATWSNQGFKISKTESERFVKFMRYFQGGHPTILKKIAEGNVIPNKLIFQFTEAFWTSRRSVSIIGFKQSKDKLFDISTYVLRTSAPSLDGVDGILDSAANLSPDEIEQTQLRIREAAEKAFQKDQFLDGMLGWTELTLMNGQAFPKFSPDQIEKVRNDQSVQKWMAATRPSKDKEAIAQSIKSLIELQSQSQNKSYVLKIFEANHRKALGEHAAAKKLFIEVLNENRYVTGVYKDLGDLYWMQYNMPTAWRCWDQGRLLAPQFNSLLAVTQYEKSLAAQYPEYF